MTRLISIGCGLFLGLMVSLSAADLHVTPDPLPGFYSESQSISVDVPAAVRVEYRFLEDVDGGYLPWKSSLLLSALPGETRTYTLRLLSTLANGESLTKDFRYTVSLASPVRPTVKPAPGYSTGPVVLEARIPQGMSASLLGQPVKFPLSLEGTAGELRSYRVEVSGARGTDDGETWVYTIDRRGQAAVGLDVLSPVPGNWANAQWLVVSQQGMDSVAWCWGETWKSDASFQYTGPVRLDVAGPSVLTVRGIAKGSLAEVVRTVRWAQDSATLSSWGLPDSGVSSAALRIPASPGIEISLDEGRSWKPMSEDRVEALVDQSLKVLSLQYRKPESKVPARVVYWMDGRTPAVPKVEFWGGWNPLITASGSTDSILSVDWVSSSGKTVTADGQWGPSATWKVPDGSIGATVTARSLNGRIAKSVPLNFPEVGWVRPEWTSWETGGGQVLPRAGFRAVYEIRSDRDVPEPTPASPTLTGPFLPTVPLGVDRTFFARLAWKDASGVVGPSTSVIAVRIDHQAPLAPRITVSRRLVKVEPADTDPGARIFYAMTTAKSSELDLPVWQPYLSAIDLDQTASGSSPRWFHALVVDAAGNPGVARLNFPLGSGASAYEWKGLTFQDPARGLSGSLADGSVVPANKILVQASWDGDVSGAWSMSTPTASLPSDWEKSMTIADKSLSFSVGDGERRSFFTWWNLKNSTGWIWEKPRLLSFTLEQGLPAPPRVTGLEAPLTRSRPWTVSAETGQTGDRLTYSLTSNGSEPSDPSGSRGLDWPGTLSWDTPEGTRTEFRLRLAVTSAAGQSREIPWGKTVVIDRTIPAALAPLAQSFQSFRSAARVALGPFPTQVRYTVSQDGSLPPIPTTESTLLASSFLEFPGIPGRQVLYRIRLRPFSEAQQPGPVGDSFVVLVDLTQAIGPTNPGSEGGDGLKVSGLPETGLSSKPVSLVISSPWGTPRFELSEGRVLAKPVESTSPVVPAELLLAGAEDADRVYTLAVRSFSQEGDPLTPEAKWTIRIDRSAPAMPDVTVELEPRRPEAIVHLEKVELQSDEHLYSRWSWSTYPSGTGQTDWSIATDLTPRFSAPNGLLTSLTVETQVRDDAGNLGAIRKQTVLLDRNVVYVSTLATDQGTGTRVDPAGNLAKALAKMRGEGRKILLLAAGSYPVGESLDWTGLEVWGGFKPGEWETTSAPSRSTLVPIAGKKLSQLVEVFGSLSLHRVDFSDLGETLTNLVRASDAQVFVEESSWQSSATNVAWRQVGGTLQLRASSAQWDGAKLGSILSFEGGRLQIQDTRWTVQNATDTRAVVLTESQAVLKGVTYQSRSSHGLETFLWSKGGEITAADLRVSSGDGCESATAFVLNQTNATMVNLDVNLSASQGNTGFQITGGQSDLQRLRQTVLKGSEYNLGMRLQNADVRLQGGFLQIDSGSYQGGVSQNGGHLVMGSTRVALAGGGQLAWGLQTLGQCTVELANVSWVLSKKTPGQPLLAQQQWMAGSSNSDSRATGW